MSSRRDELLLKRQRLDELRRQRELRQKEFSANRQSIGTGTLLEGQSTPKDRTESRKELDSLIDKLVGDSPQPSTPSPRRARPSSYISRDATPLPDGEGQDGLKAPEESGDERKAVPQQLTFAPLRTVYEIRNETPKKEIITYSKGVQTNEHFSSRERSGTLSGSEDERPGTAGSGRSRRRLSRRQRDEELRQQIRREIEEEMKSIQQTDQNGTATENGEKANFPSRPLNTEELEAVTSSADFLDFVDRSSKIIERALDEEYDVLADYRFGDVERDASSDDDGLAPGTATKSRRKGRRLKEVHQFYDPKWSKRRVVSDVSFSPKWPELILSSYTKNPSEPYSPPGLIQIWNLHMRERPEYTFHATSDILTACFSPFHPYLVLGGSYSGQVLLWDTRNRSTQPVQKTPLTGMGTGHTHPVYSLNVVGTQNAHNIVSTSTDGVLCSWSMDMLSQPQEYLELSAPPSLPPSANSTSALFPSNPASGQPLPLPRPTDDLAPLCTAFPHSDPTYLLTGTESGSIHLAHRYDRAGARSGIDARVLYAGHFAPVTTLDFHRPAGPLDLSDLLLSCGLDWSIKLWRIRTPAAASIGAPTAVDVFAPVAEWSREDAVYDVKWSPVKPGVFAAVDGAGSLEVWDLAVDSEVPVARAVPEWEVGVGGEIKAGATTTREEGGREGGTGTRVKSRALNKCAWEPHEGWRVATGGLDGVVSVFEVGNELGGAQSARNEEWARVRKLVGRLEAGG